MRPCTWTEGCQLFAPGNDLHCYYHAKVAKGLFRDRKRRRMRRRGPVLNVDDRAVLEVLVEGAA